MLHILNIVLLYNNQCGLQDFCCCVEEIQRSGLFIRFFNRFASSISHTLIRTTDRASHDATTRRDTRARHATLPSNPPAPTHGHPPAHRSATLQPYSYTSKQAAMNSSTGKSGKSGDTLPSGWYGNLVSWIRKEAIFMMLLIWRSSMNRLVASRQQPTSLLNRCSSGSRPS